MASNFEDPTQWRLKTKKGLRYKLTAVRLNYQTTKASGTVDLIIATKDMKKFVEEMLPEPKNVGNIYIPQYTFFGKTLLAVQDVDVEGFAEGYPIDPFGDDPDAPLKTYYPTLALTLNLAVPPDGEQDPDKPETYLEISSEATGDFIHTPPENMEYQDVNATGEPVGPKEVIRQPTIPHTVLCPQVMWNVKWKNVPFDSYKSILIPRLEKALGKANSQEFKPLNVVYKEIMLFVSYSYERNYTWRERFTDKPMVDVTMKFMEKKILWEGHIHGHNSQWIPGTGWRRLLMNGKPTFEKFDFNRIFVVSGP